MSLTTLPSKDHPSVGEESKETGNVVSRCFYESLYLNLDLFYITPLPLIRVLVFSNLK